MNTIIKIILASSSLLVSLVAGAAEGAGSHPKLSLCSSCHGEIGISSGSLIPNLAGQKKEYLVKALGDYRSGDRKNALMGHIAKDLSDSDIEELAAFFSSQ